ncbi:HD domain-containing protein [Amylibacter sp.]|nr:HD domain-containing protein [Amylibacter sp.]
MKEVKFTQMKDGDEEDYNFLTKHEVEHTKGTANRLLKALVELDQSLSGYKVTRLGHSLQSATRAFHSGADIDWIVSALLHDIGDIYAPYNHDEYAASIIRPFVREQCTWVVEKHGIFQMLYYGEHVGSNPHKREKYREHMYFQDCSDFCELWDQKSFDPNYDTKSINFFTPMVEEVFARKPYDPKYIKHSKREPLVKIIN